MTTENTNINAGSNNTLREAINIVTLEGLLLEKRVNEGKSASGKEYLSVTVTVEISKDEQHDISLFTMKHKKDSTEETGIYKSLRTVADEYKAVADEGVGRENADRVRVEAPQNDNFMNGVLDINDYVGGDDRLRSNPQISATFINRVPKGEEVESFAKFDTEIIVEHVSEEKNREGEETGRAKIKAYIPKYGGKVIPFDFVVPEGAAQYVLDNYEKNVTAKVNGNIVNKREMKKAEGAPTAFGTAPERITYNYVREFEVTGGTEPYDEDSPKVFNPEAVRQALVTRETDLEEIKRKAEAKKSGGGSNSGGAKMGFDMGSTPKQTNSAGFSTVDLSQDDLPF